jgi:glycerophosphoryl diester phosphodiesterase
MRLSLFAALDGRFAPVPDPRRVAWVDGCTYAHRGLHGPGVPENSLAAFQGAIDRGLGIELDVQLSLDGQPMVFHDWELDRLTAQSGPVAGRTQAALCAMKLLGGPQIIPSLAMVLKLVAGRVPLLIEIKSKRDMQVEPVCAAVLRALDGYRGNFAIIGFDPRVIRWFARQHPQMTRGLSFTDDGRKSPAARLGRHLALWYARPDFITYNVRDLPNPVAAAQRQRGLKLVAWTISDGELRARAAGCADASIAEGAGLP